LRVTESTFDGSLCCQWQLSKGERKTNCVVLHISYHWRFPCREKKTHIPPTIPFLDLAKTEQTCYFPNISFVILHISHRFHVHSLHTQTYLLKEHTTDGSEIMTPFLVYSISLMLDAGFPQRRFGFDPGDFT